MYCTSQQLVQFSTLIMVSMPSALVSLHISMCSVYLKRMYTHSRRGRDIYKIACSSCSGMRGRHGREGSDDATTGAAPRISATPCMRASLPPSPIRADFETKMKAHCEEKPNGLLIGVDHNKQYIPTIYRAASSLVCGGSSLRNLHPYRDTRLRRHPSPYPAPGKSL